MKGLMYIPRGIHSTTEVHVLRPQTHVFPPAYILSESAAHGRSYSYLHTLSFERRASAPHAYILYGALLCADHAPGKKTEPREGPPSAAARLPHHAPRPAPRRTRSTPPTPPRTHALARTIRAAIGRDLIARGPDHHFDEMLKASSFPPAPAPRNHHGTTRYPTAR
jgi:hypothetical protein